MVLVRSFVIFLALMVSHLASMTDLRLGASGSWDRFKGLLHLGGATGTWSIGAGTFFFWRCVSALHMTSIFHHRHFAHAPSCITMLLEHAVRGTACFLRMSRDHAIVAVIFGDEMGDAECAVTQGQLPL